MNIAVLCPGPSLAETWPGAPAFDLTIGVNRAALIERVDVWAFMDREVFWRTEIDYSPLVLTTRTARQSLERRGHGERLRRGGVLDFEDLRDTYPLADGPLYTSVMAVHYAATLGRVWVFGADMAGLSDFDGTVRETDRRGDSRWTREREILDRLVAAMPRRVVSVKHGIA